VRRDPVPAAHEPAEAPLREWLAAVRSYVETRLPTLAEVEALGAVAYAAWRKVAAVALGIELHSSGESSIPR
jgi:hypothetical protein